MRTFISACMFSSVHRELTLTTEAVFESFIKAFRNIISSDPGFSCRRACGISGCLIIQV